jgi:hypothetical protein
MKINTKVWLYRSDIQGWVDGYIIGFSKKRVKAFNYTLNRIGNYLPHHVKEKTN